MSPETKAARILIVDDEPHVRESISMALKYFGYDSFAVGGAEAAIESLENNQFDLITTDQSMPGMVGSELAKRIKERWPNQRILMISAYAGMLDTSTLSYVDGILCKPFMAQELKEAVAQLLSPQAKRR